MRLLLFSDLHADVEAGRALARAVRAFGADVLVGAGDFGDARQDVDACLPELQALNLPAVLVPGNNESADELRAACARWGGAHVLHGEATTVGGVTFFGLGGGVPPTPFGPWSFDLTEDEAAALLAPAPPGCVLVTHSPPKGAVDVSSRGQALGSVAVRDAVLRLGPALVVCGHVHASGGQTATLGGTTVVNAGPGGVGWTLGEASRP